MTGERPRPTPNPTPDGAQRLEALLLSSLEEDDGLCLDNEEERRRLATILANALISAAQDDAEIEALLQEIKQEQTR
jgi:hypothetical protein